MKKYKNLVLVAIAFIAGGFATIATTVALAHGGDTNLVHGCVRNNGLLNGFVRIVGVNTNCNGNETALDWNIQGIQGSPGPAGSSYLICPDCRAVDILARTNFPDLSGENFDLAILSNSFVNNEDLSGSSFVRAVLRGLQADGANFTGANLSYTNLRSSGFPNANLTNANLEGAFFHGSTLIGATFTNANVTGVIWEDTWCPDGTNSDDHSNTCAGHLTP